jgi:hypothetical protein
VQQLQSQYDSASSLLQNATQNLIAAEASLINGITSATLKAGSCLVGSVLTLSLSAVSNCATQIANTVLPAVTKVVQVKIAIVMQIIGLITGTSASSAPQSPNSTIPMMQQILQSTTYQIGYMTQQTTTCLSQVANATATTTAATTTTTVSG